MASIDQLLNLGMPGGPDFVRLAQGFIQSSPRDPTARITAVDVGLCLGAIPRLHFAALCLRYAEWRLDTPGRDRETLRVAVLRAIAKHDARAKVYPAGTPHDRIRHNQLKMAVAVLAEFADPRVCRSCKGKGIGLVHVEGYGVQAAPCAKCQGNGWVPWGAKTRARTCKLSRADWNAKHDPTYQRALDALRLWSGEGERLLRHALFGAPTKSEAEYADVERRMQAGC